LSKSFVMIALFFMELLKIISAAGKNNSPPSPGPNRVQAIFALLHRWSTYPKSASAGLALRTPLLKLRKLT